MQHPVVDRVFPIDPSDLLPAITPDNEAYWTALAEGRLLLQRCEGCGRSRHPIAPVCPYCLALGWQWQESTGRGRVFSWVKYHRSYLPEFVPLMPYVVATIELAEGARIFGLIRDTHEAPAIGAPVTLVIERWPDGRCVPAFVIEGDG